jgi:hypothetical protein
MRLPELAHSSAELMWRLIRNWRKLTPQVIGAKEAGSGCLALDGLPSASRGPKIDRGNLVAVGDHSIGEVELSVEFECSRLD